LFLLFSRQRDLDDFFHAVCADDAGHAHVNILLAVFAIQVRRAGQQLFFVAQVAGCHFNRAGRGRIERRAGLEQADDLGAAVTRTLHHFVERLLLDVAHFHHIGQRNARNRAVGHHRHHGIAMPAKHERGDVFLAGAQRLGQEIAEARRIEHTRHTDHFFGVEAGFLLHHPHHRIERVGDDDDKGIGAEFLKVLGHR
jgi:hypothetical protein